MTGPVHLLDLVPWEVADAVDYLADLDRKLSENALLKRFGRSLDDVRIELQAIPFDAEAEAEEVHECEHFRRVVRRRDGDEDDDPAGRDERDRRIYGARGRPRTAQPRPLDQLLAPLRHAVILGDPGGGKTEYLKNIARCAARAALAALKSAKKPLAEVSLPVFLHFRAVAAELDDEKSLCECLDRFGISFTAPLANALRVPAAILRALSRTNPSWSPRLARVLWNQLTAQPGDAGVAARAAKAEFKSSAKPLAEVALTVFLHLRDLAGEPGSEQLREWLPFFGIVSAAPLADSLRVPATKLQALGRSDPSWLSRLAWEAWQQLTARPDHAGAALVCLDAWDELRDGHGNLAEYLGAYVSSTAAKVLVTSRIAGYVERGAPFPTEALVHATALRICPFERPDTEAFILRFFSRNPREREIGRRLSAELRTKVPVAGMAENPLLTTLLCMAYWPDPRQQPLELPVRRGELYERILRGLLGEWPDQVVVKERIEIGPPRKGLIEPKLALITALAHRFFPTQLLTNAEIYEFLWSNGGYFAEDGPAVSPAHPLKQLIQATGLSMQDLLCEDGVLVRIGADGFSLLHLTFLEFLTARALAAKPWGEIAALIDRKSWLATWEEVVILFAGQLVDPGPLLDLMANPDKDDFLLHRTTVTGLALAEISTAARQANEERVARVTTILVDCFLESTDGVLMDEVAGFFSRPLSAVTLANGRYHGYLLQKWIEDILSIPISGYNGALVTSAKKSLRWRRIILRKRKTCWSLLRTRRLSDFVTDMMYFLTKNHFLRSLCITHIQWLDRFGSSVVTPAILAKLYGLLLTARDEEYLSWVAVEVVGKLGSLAATPEILESLWQLIANNDIDDTNTTIKVKAAKALGSMGAAAATPKVLSALSRLLADGNLRRVSAQALARMGATAATPEVLAALTRLLAGDVGDTDAAILALARMGAAAATPEIRAALVRLLIDDSIYVRHAAAGALGIEPAKTSPIVEDLESFVADNNVRALTPRILRKREILAALDSFVADHNAGGIGMGAAVGNDDTNDDDTDIKRTVRNAVLKMGPGAASTEMLAALGHRFVNDDISTVTVAAGLAELKSKLPMIQFRRRAFQILISFPNLRAFERKSGWVVCSVDDLGRWNECLC